MHSNGSSVSVLLNFVFIFFVFNVLSNNGYFLRFKEQGFAHVLLLVARQERFELPQPFRVTVLETAYLANVLADVFKKRTISDLNRWSLP
jgi:hypothetical protein